ncbi:hypothetical protein CC117_00060 [Parafrankia colletiae]|uniref:Uncharacterized protein n=1 Tax=Parafrankia colletiae TaxID=573497 RepID=A0A1S1RKU1_9ACTN|nr:hypothetical protein CC117_00060 [Parafrankia colletiae]
MRGVRFRLHLAELRGDLTGSGIGQGEGEVEGGSGQGGRPGRSSFRYGGDGCEDSAASFLRADAETGQKLGAEAISWDTERRTARAQSL